MANATSTVVGIFLDDKWAQKALKALQSAGFQARVADESTVNRLADLGIDSNAASVYSSRYGEGNTIIVVDNAADRGEEALGIMLQNGAENIDMSKGRAAAAGTTTTTTTTTQERQYGHYNEQLGRASTADEMQVQLHDETLTPVKQAVQAGEVQVQKVVHEQQQEIPVNLRHEEVVIERHAVDRPADPNEIGELQDQVISVPVYEERAELQKQARVREEVTIGKRAAEHQETLSGTTRHEELEVNQSGNIVVDGEDRALGYDGGQTDANYNQR